MATETLSKHGGARQRVGDGLARLKQAFPLEARIAEAAAALRAAYVELLRHWASGHVPTHDIVAPEQLTSLLNLDAVVLHPDGISCYPFSAHPTGIRVAFGDSAVHAMCAVDALAIARLLNRACALHSACAGCGTAVDLDVNADGSLDHRQLQRGHVWWKPRRETATHCAEGLCQDLRFLCPACSANPAELYTLPEAAAIGNAFFAFQRQLLSDITTPA